MGFIFLLGCVSALVSQAVADPFALNAAGVCAVPLAGSQLMRRAADEECFSSVASELSAPTPSNSDLYDWATSVEADVIEHPCTITVPASLSKDYMSYLDVVSSWASNLKSEAEAITTDCGYDTMAISLSQVCTASQTLVFTQASATASASTTVLKAVDYPTGTIAVGDSKNAGSQNRGMVGMATLISVAIGAVVFL